MCFKSKMTGHESDKISNKKKKNEKIIDFGSRNSRNHDGQ